MPIVAREVRKIDNLPFDELPPVLFREEVQFLYTEIATLRVRLEQSDLRRQTEKRQIKLKLAHLRDEIMKQRSFYIQARTSTRGLDTVLQALNVITRSI